MGVQNDKRYRMFDYISEKREEWLRVSRVSLRCVEIECFKEYMSSMAAPKLSVHIG